MSLKFAVFVTLTTLSALGLSQNQAQASEPVAPDEPTLTSLGGGSSVVGAGANLRPEAEARPRNKALPLSVSVKCLHTGPARPRQSLLSVGFRKAMPEEQKKGVSDASHRGQECPFVEP